MRPAFEAKDKYGRTCLHHAAAAGNLIGLEFTKQAMKYWYVKNNGHEMPEGAFIDFVKVLTNGGMTPLMKAVESDSVSVV